MFQKIFSSYKMHTIKRNNFKLIENHKFNNNNNNNNKILCQLNKLNYNYICNRNNYRVIKCPILNNNQLQKNEIINKNFIRILTN